MKCLPAADLFNRCEQQLFNCSIVSSSATYLPALEKLLLDLTAYGCAEGVFYCLALQQSDHVVVRFFEAGCFKGLMKNRYLPHMSATAGIDVGKFVLMKLFTSSDVNERAKALCDRRQSISSSRRTGK